MDTGNPPSAGKPDSSFYTPDPMMVRALNQRQSQAPMRFFEAGTHGQDMGGDDLPPAVKPASMEAAKRMHLDPDEVDFEPTVTSSADTVTYGDGRDPRDWAPGEFGGLNRDVDRGRQRYLEIESEFDSDVEFDIDLDIRNRIRNEKRKGFVDLQAQPEEVDLQPPEQESDPIISTGSDERLWHYSRKGTQGMWTDAASMLLPAWASGVAVGVGATGLWNDRRARKAEENKRPLDASREEPRYRPRSQG